MKYLGHNIQIHNYYLYVLFSIFKLKYANIYNFGLCLSDYYNLNSRFDNNLIRFIVYYALY